MLEVNDVTVPTCFIITNQKLLPLPEIAVHTSDAAEQETKIECANRWLNGMSRVGTAIVSTLKDPVSQAIKTATEHLLDEETLYLYLIDERTMLPLVIRNDPIYPIVIKKSNPHDAGLLSKILPLLKVPLLPASLSVS
jgi:hypothetical protein